MVGTLCNHHCALRIYNFHNPIVVFPHTSQFLRSLLIFSRGTGPYFFDACLYDVDNYANFEKEELT